MSQTPFRIERLHKELADVRADAALLRAEIERLREELADVRADAERLRAALVYISEHGHMPEVMIMVARRALGQKP